MLLLWTQKSSLKKSQFSVIVIVFEYTLQINVFYLCLEYKKQIIRKIEFYLARQTSFPISKLMIDSQVTWHYLQQVQAFNPHYNSRIILLLQQFQVLIEYNC